MRCRHWHGACYQCLRLSLPLSLFSSHVYSDALRRLWWNDFTEHSTNGAIRSDADVHGDSKWRVHTVSWRDMWR